MNQQLILWVGVIGMLLMFVLGYNAGLRRAERLLDEKFPWLKDEIKK